MARLAYDDVVGDLYAAAMDPALWGHAIDRIAAHVGAVGGILVFNDFATASGQIVQGGLRDDMSELFLERHVRNPWAMEIAKRSVGQPLSLRSMPVPDQQFKTSAMFADLFAPQGMADMITLPCETFRSANTAGGIGLGLNERQCDDMADRCERLHRIGPHIARAVDLCFELTRWRREQRRFEIVLDAIADAAMLIDWQGRMVLANRDAETALMRADTLRKNSDGTLGVTGQVSMSDQALGAFLDAALRGQRGDDARFRPNLVVPRKGGIPPFMLLATPLRCVREDFWGSLAPCASLLLQIIDPLTLGQADEHWLQDSFAMTPAEARVAALIAAGVAPPAIATLLDVRVTTVRTHLARCFDKTGARSQVALARLLAAFTVHRKVAPTEAQDGPLSKWEG